MYALALSLALSLSLAPDTSEDCGEQVCMFANAGDDALDSDAAGSWKPDAHLSRKQRKAEAKRNRKRKDVTVRVMLDGGRGSVFVDGRYLASEGPHAERALRPGKHEVEVRDGDTILCVGVLTIPRKATELTLVVHADR
jgi:hypothetical protein